MAMFYKTYLHEKLNKEPFAGFTVITGPATAHFFPLEKENFAPDKHHIVRKANIALRVFWYTFALGIITGFIKHVL